MTSNNFKCPRCLVDQLYNSKGDRVSGCGHYPPDRDIECIAKVMPKGHTPYGGTFNKTLEIKNGKWLELPEFIEVFSWQESQ